jgi:predicted house-cleaning noncanonical NTP pyrophosphatase (MazG superfamily)
VSAIAAPPGLERERLVKVVRDGMPRLLLAGDGVRYQPITDRDALLAALRAKLIEESIEYLTDPSASEAADVLEVLRALAHHDMQIPWREIERARRTKFAARGGYHAGVGLYVISHASTRHEATGARAGTPRRLTNATAATPACGRPGR